MRIAFVDTYYPEFLKSWSLWTKDYETELRRLLNFSFGTADFYSRHFQMLGWETLDIIANYKALQDLWPGRRTGDILRDQLEAFGPDVVFMQDLSLSLPIRPRILAGQCSCAMPPEEKVKQFDIIFTSFPHYVDRFAKMGVKAVYNPLAFDQIVLDRSLEFYTRSGCVFIGGVGRQWPSSQALIEQISREIPESTFWGYGYGAMPVRFRGPAWGMDMYRILRRSKIALNRHIGVAEGHANNMRLFETTGCGAMLLTDRKGDFFTDKEAVEYSDPKDAADKARYYLDHEIERREIAFRGQDRTFRDHLYMPRMVTISNTLKGML